MWDESVLSTEFIALEVVIVLSDSENKVGSDEVLITNENNQMANEMPMPYRM